MIPLELVDPYYYHLDTCFCPLSPGEAIYFPPAFDDYGRKALEELVTSLIPVDEEEARLGRWLFQPWAVTLGVPLGLGLLLAALMPSAVAQTELTCRAAGGIWWVATERYPAACTFQAHGRLNQATGEADAGSS